MTEPAPVPAWAESVPDAALAWVRAWELAIAVARRDPPDLPARFIHRDPHPGNTLWRDRRLTGIVDWTAASGGRRRSTSPTSG